MFIGNESCPMAGNDQPTRIGKEDIDVVFKDLRAAAGEVDGDVAVDAEQIHGLVNGLIDEANADIVRGFLDGKYTLTVEAKNGDLTVAIGPAEGDPKKLSAAAIKAHSEHKPFDLALMLIGAAQNAVSEANNRLVSRWKIEHIIRKAMQLKREGRLDELHAKALLTMLYGLAKEHDQEEE